MYSYEEKKQPSIINLVLIVITIMFIMGFSVLALMTGDPLWFVSEFNLQPNAIEVLCYGEGVTINPSSPQFASLSAMFNENFSQTKNWDSLTMSDETWAEYQTGNATMTLVLSYPETFRVHSTYKYFSNIDTLIIPLDGRHSGSNAVFGLAGDLPSSGAFHIPETDNLNQFITTNGICTN